MPKAPPPPSSSRSSSTAVTGSGRGSRGRDERAMLKDAINRGDKKERPRTAPQAGHRGREEPSGTWERYAPPSEVSGSSSYTARSAGRNPGPRSARSDASSSVMPGGYKRIVAPPEAKKASSLRSGTSVTGSVVSSRSARSQSQSQSMSEFSGVQQQCQRQRKSSVGNMSDLRDAESSRTGGSSYAPTGDSQQSDIGPKRQGRVFDASTNYRSDFIPKPHQERILVPRGLMLHMHPQWIPGDKKVDLKSKYQSTSRAHFGRGAALKHGDMPAAGQSTSLDASPMMCDWGA